MNIVNHLVEEYFEVVNGQLTVEGVAVSEIAKQYETPFFFYLPSIFHKKLSRLRLALPGFEICYAVKANPSPGIVQYFIKENCGLNVATSTELFLAISCGCPCSRILLSGAGKTNRELVAGCEKSVAEIYAESLEEVRQISLLAEKRRQNIRVSLRINPGEVSINGKVYMPAAPAAYGFDEEMVDIAVEAILRQPRLKLCGINAYWGTQHLDDQVLCQTYRHILSLAGRITEKFKIDIETIDFGGGFGVPYYANENEFALEAFGKSVQSLIEEARHCVGIEKARFVIEPGRYLVADGGLYVTRVMNCKDSRDKHFIVVDGGIHHHLAATGNLGQVIKKNFPMAIANRMNEPHDVIYNITGRQCTSLDTLARNIALPAVQEGDILVIFQSGAYVRSVSPLGFRSHPEPIEIMMEKESMKIIRRNSCEQDILRGTSLDK